MSNRFSKALINPFSTTAMGSRVPDLFSFPTATYHLHGTAVLGGVNSKTSGSVTFLPNPLLSMVDTEMINSGTYTLVNGCVSKTSMGNYVTNKCYYGAAIGSSTANSLDDVLSMYRVVSWGIKITNLQPELSATGRLAVAMAPCGDEIPGFNNLTGYALTGGQGISFITGVDCGVHASANILNLPSGFEIAVQDLLHGDLEISGTYVSPRYFDFKNSTDLNTYSSSYYTGDSVTVTSLGVVGGTSNKDPVRMSGGCAILLYWEGLPVGVPAFQVEYIYHLEGTPTLSSSATLPISSTGISTYVGSTSITEAGMAAVSGMKSVQWIARGADFLNKVSKNPLVGALASLAM